MCVTIVAVDCGEGQGGSRVGGSGRGWDEGGQEVRTHAGRRGGALSASLVRGSASTRRSAAFNAY